MVFFTIARKWRQPRHWSALGVEPLCLVELKGLALSEQSQPQMEFPTVRLCSPGSLEKTEFGKRGPSSSSVRWL